MMPSAVVEVVAGPSSVHLVELSAVKKRLGIPPEIALLTLRRPVA